MMYIGIKIVDATPMTAEDAKKKDYRVGNDKEDVYEVTYEDGYKSWCPKNVFEKQYFAVNDKDKDYAGLLIAFIKDQLQENK